MHGRFYEADWISKKDPLIVLLVLDQEAGEREALLYIELSTLSHLKHSFGLVKNDRQSIMLIQERTLHGNLQCLLQNGVFQSSPKVLVEIFLQIVDVMVYVTNQNITYGNLRCANVLVFQMDPSEPTKNMVKITNFSSARGRDQPVTKNRLSCGPVRLFVSQPFLNIGQSNDSELSDIYSMGVLMWQACSKGRVPYERRRSVDNIQQRKLNDEKLQDNQRIALMNYGVLLNIVGFEHQVYN
jgi:serine/threonine protein kinase